jgi:hypothetical protein
MKLAAATFMVRQYTHYGAMDAKQALPTTLALAIARNLPQHNGTHWVPVQNRNFANSPVCYRDCSVRSSSSV